MKILFICKHNKTRSKVAEAFFKKLNKNKKHEVKSAGIIKGRSISDKEVEYFKKYKLKINHEPQSLSTNLVRWADLIIIVANDVPKSLFRTGKKIKMWRISDATVEEGGKMETLISKIELRIKKLMEEISQ
jgi:protein-tyrosine-phosphatase